MKSESAIFEATVPESKALECEGKCKKVTPHVFVANKVATHYFTDYDGKQVNGSGLKSVWACHACGALRIYGAPIEEETN